jgi:hypothetical protein
MTHSGVIEAPHSRYLQGFQTRTPQVVNQLHCTILCQTALLAGKAY